MWRTNQNTCLQKIVVRFQKLFRRNKLVQRCVCVRASACAGTCICRITFFPHSFISIKKKTLWSHQCGFNGVLVILSRVTTYSCQLLFFYFKKKSWLLSLLNSKIRIREFNIPFTLIKWYLPSILFYSILLFNPKIRQDLKPKQKKWDK